MFAAKLLKRTVILQMLLMFKYFITVILWNVSMQEKIYIYKMLKDLTFSKYIVILDMVNGELHESGQDDLHRSAHTAAKHFSNLT